jgi:hypothetical protein
MRGIEPRVDPPVSPTLLVFQRVAKGVRSADHERFGMDRGLERIADVSSRGSDVVALWRDVSEIVAPLVPNLMGPCCFTLDPASLLMTSHFNPALTYELPEEMLRGEYLVDDVHDMASVAGRPAAFRRSTPPRAVTRAQSALAGQYGAGGDQELLVSLRTRAGATWGTLGLYRAPARSRSAPMRSSSSASRRPLSRRVFGGRC